MNSEICRNERRKSHRQKDTCTSSELTGKMSYLILNIFVYFNENRLHIYRSIFYIPKNDFLFPFVFFLFRLTLALDNLLTFFFVGNFIFFLLHCVFQFIWNVFMLIAISLMLLNFLPLQLFNNFAKSMNVFQFGFESFFLLIIRLLFC